MLNKETMREVGVIGGLIGVQFMYAGNSVLASYLMMSSLGLDALTVVIFYTFAAFFVLTPLAILFERKQWPRSVSLKLAAKLVLTSFAGVTVFQSLYLEGMKHTSASVATAMPNLCPAFIFIVAWTLGMEKVKLSCVYSRVKIGGTVLCVMGALVMSFMHSTSSPVSNPVEVVNALTTSPYDVVFDKDKLIGCLCLLAAVLVLSAYIILQASVLSEFPAPISMCAMTSLIGVIITAPLRFFLHGKSEHGGHVIGLGRLVGYAMLGGAVNGGSMSFSGWAIKEKGPVTVSLFSPIATVVSLLLSVVTLGDNFNLGSFAGMALMFGGLYFVLWAKAKENYGDEEGVLQSQFEPQKPLSV